MFKDPALRGEEAGTGGGRREEVARGEWRTSLREVKHYMSWAMRISRG